jgi:hypothetical protein
MRHPEEAPPPPGFGACLGDVASFGLAVADDPLRAVESYVTLCGVVSEVRRLRSDAPLSAPRLTRRVDLGCHTVSRALLSVPLGA